MASAELSGPLNPSGADNVHSAANDKQKEEISDDQRSLIGEGAAAQRIEGHHEVGGLKVDSVGTAAHLSEKNAAFAAAMAPDDSGDSDDSSASGADLPCLTLPVSGVHSALPAKAHTLAQKKFRFVLSMLPSAWRLYRFNRNARAEGTTPVLDVFADNSACEVGVPVGGIGSGSINRDRRGCWKRFQLNTCQSPFYDTVWANQFSVRSGDRAVVLCGAKPKSKALRAWNWNANCSGAEYRALFPQAWTSFPDPLGTGKLAVEIHQLSPVIAGDYKESSYPGGSFAITLRAPKGAAAKENVSLMFTFSNCDGSPAAAGRRNRKIEVPGGVGIELKHSEQLSFGISATCDDDKADISYLTRWRSDGEGAKVWRAFSRSGHLPNIDNNEPTKDNEEIAAAICVTIPLGGSDAQQEKRVVFSVCWDSPHIIDSAGSVLRRRYTDFFDSPALPSLLSTFAMSFDAWRRAISDWQKPVVTDASLPLWYRALLMNEVYFVVDGGIIWGYLNEEKHYRFGWLEGLEYRMINTLDVHFFASWTLIKLWPDLQKAVMRDFASATLAQDLDQHKLMFSGELVSRSLKDVVPHDLGTPGAAFLKVNAYNLHNPVDWKDLSPKFVLMVWRDWKLTADEEYLKATWLAVKRCLSYARRFDKNGDFMIENEGSDHTFDVWAAHGVSAYSGGLWTAAMMALLDMARHLNDRDVEMEWAPALEKARKVYAEKLWDAKERYFIYSEAGESSTDVMAAALAGEWYLRSCGLSFLKEERVRAHLHKVWKFNVQKYSEDSDFTKGAVNGMKIDGTVENSSMESEEVWTGVTYAVASQMLQMGMVVEGMETAKGIFNLSNLRGMHFRTPEAYDSEGKFRSLTYMRPLSIWAMQHSIDQTCATEEGGDVTKRERKSDAKGRTMEPTGEQDVVVDVETNEESLSLEEKKAKKKEKKAMEKEAKKADKKDGAKM